ncbi:MAG: hypothetical protein ACTHQM_15870 [Thermoanaerobaculia bacterium]
MPATFADRSIRILELSVVGFLVAHELRLAADETHRLVIEWQGARLELDCLVVRSTLWRLGKTMGERSIYHSGLRIVDVSRESFDTLRELIAERVVRALEEQKANAYGIPPLAAYMYRYQPEKGELYRRCELVNGTWRKTETIRSAQPMNGFTVSADVNPEHIDMLCQTWEMTTGEGRRLTRLLAELSISKAEGVPTRRYVP